MSATVEIPVYKTSEHGDIQVTEEAWCKFMSLLPEETRCEFEKRWPVQTLSDVVDISHDHMSDYVHKCQRRPALPHERDDHGGGFYLTKKGTAKYNYHLQDIAAAFKEAFCLAPIRSKEWGPVDGPLDPLTYD